MLGYAREAILFGSSAPFVLPPVSRPAVVLTDAWNLWWNSKGFGTSAPTGYNPVTRFRLLVTTGITPISCHMGTNSGDPSTTSASYMCNGGVSGINSAGLLANMTTLNNGANSAEMARPTIIGGNVNDSNGTLAGYAIDWPTQVKTNTEAGAALPVLAGSGKSVYYLLDDAQGSFCNGARNGADHVYFRRTMRAAHGNKVIDLNSYLRHKVLGTSATGPDRIWAEQFGSVPVSLRANISALNIPYNDAAPVTSTIAPSNTTDLNYDPGQIWISITTGSATLYQKVSANGQTGSPTWASFDDQHFSARGGDTIALLFDDVTMANGGAGPPYVDCHEFVITKDIASAATVGQLVYVGTATAFYLTDTAGAAQTAYAISNTGLITRTASGSLSEGVTALMVTAVNSYGVLTSYVDITVKAASTVTAPTFYNIASPGIIIGGRQAHPIANDKGFWWVFHGSMSLAQASYFMSFLNALGVTNVRMNFECLTTGRLSGSIVDASNVLVLNYGSPTVGGIRLPDATRFCLMFSATTDTLGTLSCYLGDTSFMTGTGQTFTVVPNTVLPFQSMYPQYLGGSAPAQGALASAAHLFFGDLALFAFGSGFIDWSVQANRRAFIDGSGNPAVRTRFDPVASTGLSPAHEIWGDDLLWGAANPLEPKSLLVPSFRARTLRT